MALLVFAALVLVPMAEIGLFIQVGGFIGLWPTLAVVVLTAMAGSALLRAQGLQTLRQAQANLDRGQFPVAEVFDGLCLLFAGALLLTPGFLTDAIGLALFVPGLRRALRKLLLRWLAQRGTVHVRASAHAERSGDGAETTIIEGEYEVAESEERRPGPDRDGKTPRIAPRGERR